MLKKGSEGGKIKKKLNLEFIKDPTSLDLTPTSPQMLRANPGGAIPQTLNICSCLIIYGKRETNRNGFKLF